MPRIVTAPLLVLFFSLAVIAQQPTPQQPWAVTVQPNTTASSTISVVNQCRRNHSFQIQKQNLPFLTISQPQIQVAGGQTVNVAVRFDTTGLATGVHQGQVLIACTTCKSEPTCAQDRDILPVVLTVPTAQPPVPAPSPVSTTTVNDPQPPADRKRTPKVDAVFGSFSKGPCPELGSNCDKLRALAAEKESAAQQAAAEAAGKTAAANSANQNADKAAADAKKAADAVEPEGKTTAVVNGEGFTQADSDHLEKLRKQNQDEYLAGKKSEADYQKRANELDTKKAREERLAEQARLKQEADAAAKKAADTKAEADRAQAAADAAKKDADDAARAAAEALAEYQRCLKRIEDECLRVAAEKKRKDDEAAAAAAVVAAEDKRRKDAEDAAKAQQAQIDYLLDNIRQLGLITYKPKTKVPDPLDWFFDAMQKLTGQTVRDFLQSVAGQVGGGPIDPNYINALGELYKALGSFFDIRTKAGKDRALEKLQDMINPKTGRKYTLNEALAKIDAMEDLMRKLRDKLREAQKEAAKSK